MNEDDEPTESGAISLGQTAQSPEQGKADSLRLKLLSSNLDGTPPFVLSGSFKIGVDTTGRYDSKLPAPIHVVAVARSSGRVFIGRLFDSEDMPPSYLGASAPPSIVREGPDGPSSAGISESGYFTVDLKKHLVLPDKADDFDVFLWLETIASDVVRGTKPPQAGDSAGANLYQRPATIAAVRAAAKSDTLELSFKQVDDARHITGKFGQSRVSLVAYSLPSNLIGWTVIETTPGTGMEVDVLVKDLLPKLRPEERVLVFAIADGRRSALLDIPGM